MKIHQRILAIIKQNYGNPQFGVEMLAKLSGLSQAYLRETVYRYYRISPQLLIENIRLEKALYLISKDNCTLYDTRQQTGFAYAKSFRRAIKRRLDMTPSELQTLFAQSENGCRLKELRKTLWQNDQRNEK